MADIKFVAAKCPSCGAGLQVPDNLDKVHCLYCGSQVLIRKACHGKLECKVCDGFGRIDVCRACGGSGDCRWRVSSPPGQSDFGIYIAYGSESHCDHGRCSACRGRGSAGLLGSCPFCGGTGKCPWCLGNSRCSGCDGLGVLRGPSGLLICPGCGGKGYIEGEPPKAPKLDKCPDCGLLLTDDMFFCPRCGFVRGCPKCLSAWPRGSMMCPVCGFRKGDKI